MSVGAYILIFAAVCSKNTINICKLPNIVVYLFPKNIIYYEKQGKHID